MRACGTSDEPSLALENAHKSQSLYWFCHGSVQPLRSRNRPAQKRPTVASELKRLAAEGTARRPRTPPPTARSTSTRAGRSSLTGARKIELGGVISDLEGMAARDAVQQPVAAPRAVPDAAPQRRVLEPAAAAELRRTAELHRLRARLPVLSRPRPPDPVARDVRQAQRLLERRQALRRAGGRAAGRDRCRSPPSARAASRGSTCSRSTASGRRGSARSPRAPACRRWPAPPPG